MKNSTIKKITSVVLALISLFLVFSIFTFSNTKGEKAVAAEDEVLKVYNWADYIDLSVIADFEKEYKAKTGKSIRVVYSTFETNETMLNSIVNTAEKGIDLICPSEYTIEKLMRMKLIQPLDKAKIPNISNIDSKLYEIVDDTFKNIKYEGKATPEKMSDYFVPYMMGTLGVLYNKSIVSEEEAKKAGYGLLWNSINNPKLKKKITMKDSVRDTYVAAVLYLKEQNRLPGKYASMSISNLINNTDDELIELVKKVLLEQQKNLKEYEVDTAKQEIEKGDVYVSLAWSGDAIYAIEKAAENNVELGYIFPQIGGNIWFDGWAITKTSANVEAAHAFIDYLCNPVVAMKNAAEIGYTSGLDKEIVKANKEAVNVLVEKEYIESAEAADDYFEDENIYPTISEITGVMTDFGDNQQKVIKMWESVKAAKSNPIIVIVSVVGVFAVVTLAILVTFIVKRQKSKKVRKIDTSSKTQEAESNEDEEYEEDEDDEEDDKIIDESKSDKAEEISSAENKNKSEE